VSFLKELLFVGNFRRDGAGRHDGSEGQAADRSADDRKQGAAGFISRDTC
jgi:hypothetical protein